MRGRARVKCVNEAARRSLMSFFAVGSLARCRVYGWQGGDISQRSALKASSSSTVSFSIGFCEGLCGVGKFKWYVSFAEVETSNAPRHTTGDDGSCRHGQQRQ